MEIKNENSIKNLIKSLKERKNILEQKKHIYELEMKELENDEKVKRYNCITDKFDELDEKIKNIEIERKKLSQELCKHDFVYLLEYNKKQETYTPIFKCICCEKKIKGYLNYYQECVNQNYLRKQNDLLYGSIEEYDNLKEKYDEIINNNLSKIDIRKSLDANLSKDYDHSVLILRK